MATELPVVTLQPRPRESFKVFQSAASTPTLTPVVTDGDLSAPTPPTTLTTTTRDQSGAATTASGTRTSDITVAVSTHTIFVGLNSAFFDPPQLKANVGDSVEFNFLAGESWIIRGDFDTPCVPYDYISSSGTGFSSGPIYLNDDDVQTPQFSVMVQDTEPMFFYNGAPGGCDVRHQAGVINPSQDKTLNAWLRQVMRAKSQIPAGNTTPLVTATRAEEVFPTITAIPGNLDQAANSTNANSHISRGQIAGLVIGCVATLLLALALLCYTKRTLVGCGCREFRKNYLHEKLKRRQQSKIWTRGQWWQLADTSQPSQERWQHESLHSPQEVFNRPVQYPAITSSVPTTGYQTRQVSTQSIYNLQASPLSTLVSPLSDTGPMQGQAGIAELPTSSVGHNTLLPRYTSERSSVPDSKRYSWTATDETSYRPSARSK